VMERIESSGAPEDGTCLRLAALRNRAGLSMAAVAKALGMANASSYQRYEDPTLFTKKYLPLELAEKLAEVLGGYGDPPIQVAEVMALAGVTSDDPAEQRRHRLRLVMEKHNLTPAEWAKKAGVVSSVIYNFLNGHSDSLSAQTMEKLERAIGVAAPGDIDESEPLDAMLLRLIVSAHRKIERLEKEVERLKAPLQPNREHPPAPSISSITVNPPPEPDWENPGSVAFGDDGSLIGFTEPPPSIGSDPEEIRRWIRGRCEATGLTPSALARAAGVAHSTLNRFLNDENAEHVPSSRTLEKIARVTGGARG
jgi:transcriptional regulator with XRE-family HTH domain